MAKGDRVLDSGTRLGAADKVGSRGLTYAIRDGKILKWKSVCKLGESRCDSS
jgi:hypothetical protein